MSKEKIRCLKKRTDVYDQVEEEAKVFVPKSSKLNIYRFYPSPCANFHLLVTKEENFCHEGGGGSRKAQ